MRTPQFLSILLTLPALMTFLSCSGGKKLSEQQSAPLSVTEIASDSYSSVEKAQNRLILTTDDWSEIWELTQAGRIPPNTMPRVNFDTHCLIACFMGMKPNGGYSIKVESATLSGDTVHVTAVQYAPGQNCMVTDVITNPYVIVSVAREGIRNAVFELSEKVENCD